MSTDQVKNIPADTPCQMAHDALTKVGVREDIIHPVVDGLVWTSLRGIDSHGIRLLPHYVEGVRMAGSIPIRTWSLSVQPLPLARSTPITPSGTPPG